jgi:hypothetical protein
MIKDASTSGLIRLEMNSNNRHIGDDCAVPDPHAAAFAMSLLQQAALRTLLYFDIWEYPLNALELNLFRQASRIQEGLVDTAPMRTGDMQCVMEHQGFFYVKGRTPDIVERRQRRERHSRWMWTMARVSMHVIKRFPFVRAVMVSGDLSKNATGRGSDVDFFILTEPGRLWIARTLLILFKKLFLLNSKKFFCLNYFKTTDHLMEADQNLYSATEVAYLKPLYNMALFRAFMGANSWVTQVFPNFREGILSGVQVNNRRSRLQRVIEALCAPLPLERVDTLLMDSMRRIWARRYPEHDERTRNRIFRCSKQESCAYAGDFQEKVLSMYAKKLEQFGIDP